MAKKLLAMVVLIGMLASLAAGCSSTSSDSGASAGSDASSGSSTSAESSAAGETQDLSDVINETGLPIVKEGAQLETMTMYWVAEPYALSEPEDVHWIKQNEEETGVKFEWIKTPQEGAVEKINLLLASGDLPDVFWNGITQQTIVQYMGQDIFLPTEDLVANYMPNLQKVYEQRPDYQSLTYAPDGHSYGFPYIEELYGLVLSPGPMIIYKPWLDQLGLEVPTTLDEFTEVLRAFKAAGDLNGNGEADEVPYAMSLTSKETFGSHDTFHVFTGCFGQADSARRAQDDHLTIQDGKVVYTAINDAYRDTCNYFHQLNEEGLIDPDSYSPAPNQASALYMNKLQQDVPIVGVCGVWTRNDAIPNPEIRDNYVALPRLTGPKGKSGYILNYSEMQSPCNTTITTKCKYPEIVARWADVSFEPIHSITQNWGTIPYIHVMTEDGKLDRDVDESGAVILKDGLQTYQEMRQFDTPIKGSLAILSEYYDEYYSERYNATSNTRNVSIPDQNINGKQELLQEYEAIPQFYLTAEEQQRVSQIQPQLENIIDSYQMRWILDGGADEEWETYKSDLAAAGLDEFVSIFQGAYDRYVENMQ